MISREKEKSIRNSLCYSALLDSEFVGFARVITDFSTFNYICDFFILPRHQGKGFGQRLLKHMTEDPQLKEGGHLLLTRDAHELYRKFGFNYVKGNTELINKLMYKKDPRRM